MEEVRKQALQTDVITEAIILAGGLGTRLREAVPDLPKSLAPVAGRPFLSYVIDALRIQGVQRIIFSLGYMSELITSFLDTSYPTLDYTVVLEDEPLGTGGAIKKAIAEVRGENVIITNGDTLYHADLQQLWHLHNAHAAVCTLALKPMQNFDRYGVVTIDTSGRVSSFLEKRFYDTGLINGGIYILNKTRFQNLPLPEKFSFEREFLEAWHGELNIYGLASDGYFIDIGIPEDFERAGRDLERKELDLSKIDFSWTLFLDRDGVINEERVGYYVLHWDEFIFSAGVLDVFKKLTSNFGTVFVVSNQRGVGKGLMTEEGLQSIHLEMQREIAIAGGHVEKIFYCTDRDDRSYFRKPNPGMAFLAKKEFPAIDFSRSIMVGNKPSDMCFGRAAGMFTVFVATTNPDQPFPHPDIDLFYPSLAAFAGAL